MKNIVIIENTFYTVLSLRMEIIKHLQRNGYKISVLSSGIPADADRLRDEGCNVYDLGTLVNNPLSALRYSYRLFTLLRNIQPKIIFTFTIRPNILGSIMGRLLQLPVVSNVTGIGPLFESNSLLYFTIRQVYRLAFRKTKTVFFQNEEDLNLFLSNQYVSPSQAKLLPGSGVDTEYYKPRESTPERPFTFLMISRLIFDKGVMEFVKASELLKQTFPDIKCQILGPYWTQNVKKNTVTKEQISEWESRGWIEYLGHTFDVRPFIEASDCIVLPSYREGCANVLMQGASMGKPLISTDVTGCNNLILNNETGYLCEVRNHEDLALKMKQLYLLSDETRIQMGSKGRDYIKTHYQKSIVLDAYLKEV